MAYDVAQLLAITQTQFSDLLRVSPAGEPPEALPKMRLSSPPAPITARPSRVSSTTSAGKATCSMRMKGMLGQRPLDRLLLEVLTL